MLGSFDPLHPLGVDILLHKVFRSNGGNSRWSELINLVDEGMPSINDCSETHVMMTTTMTTNHSCLYVLPVPKTKFPTTIKPRGLLRACTIFAHLYMLSVA